MINVQNITLEHTKKGVTQEYVFKNIIQPRYQISRATYYTYLGAPAKRELKRLESIQKQQLQLF